MCAEAEEVKLLYLLGKENAANSGCSPTRESRLRAWLCPLLLPGDRSPAPLPDVVCLLVCLEAGL